MHRLWLRHKTCGRPFIVVSCSWHWVYVKYQPNIEGDLATSHHKHIQLISLWIYRHYRVPVKIFLVRHEVHDGTLLLFTVIEHHSEGNFVFSLPISSHNAPNNLEFSGCTSIMLAIFTPSSRVFFMHSSKSIDEGCNESIVQNELT